ncbi:MAG TPA: hypothetical protein VHB48_14955 [Chitinophagaceae bacterium]|nr:hypothetical protein [Chitinophagaceae bacterium]
MRRFCGNENYGHLKVMLAFTRATFTLFALFTTYVCTGQPGNLHIDTNNTVVLPFASVKTFMDKGFKTSVLNDRDLATVDSLVLKVVHDNHIGEDLRAVNAGATPAMSLKQIKNIYNRQVICYADSHGDKIVWVLYFCSSEQPINSLKNGLVMVDDGGDCFFNFKVNIKKRTAFDVMVNGVV